MPSFSDSANQGAPSGWLNGVDWKHIGFVFLVSFLGFVATFLTSFLIPYLQDHGLISVAVGTAFATAIAAFLRLVNDGTKIARMVLIGLSVALLSGATTLADDTVYDLSGLTVGDYRARVSADGTITFSPLRVVRPTPGPLPPNPPPLPPNPPTPLTDRGKAVMTAALAVAGDPDRGGTAHGLAELYRQLAAVFRASPTATQAQLFTALSTANNTFLSARNVATVWAPVRGVIGTYWTALTNPTLTPPSSSADFAALLEESAVGLDASAPAADGDKAINPDLIKLIMQIIQIILALLQPTPTPGH